MLRRIFTAVLGTVLLAAGLISSGTIPAAGVTTLTIGGTVTDSATGIPLDNVCITVGPPIRCWTATNALGFYLIDLTGAPAGQSWDLHFLRTGYDQIMQTATNLVGPTTVNMAMVKSAGVVTTPIATPPPNLVAPVQPAVPSCTPSRAGTPTNTVYLPNVTKTLGGVTGWQTPFIIQNTGAASTDLEVSFYAFSDGTCIARLARSALLPGTSQAYIPNNMAELPDGTQFSVVVRSFGSTVVGVVNEQAGTGDRAEAMSYDGVSTGSTTVSLPNITRRFYGFETPFIIQNLGTAATMATARFVSFDGSAPSFSIIRTIDPGRAKPVDPNVDDQAVGAPGAVDGKQYAVTVTADQPLAVVVNTQNDAPWVDAPVAYASDGLMSGSASVYGAYAAKNTDGIGRVSTIVVQNTGSAAVTPSLTFTPLGGGSSQTFSAPSTVPAGGAWAFDPRFDLGTTTPCSSASATCLANGEYSFVASASGPVAAVVNVLSAKTGMGYAATGTPSAKYFLPNVTKTLGGSAGWTTPIILQSVTASSATLSWYKFSDGSLAYTQELPLAAGSAVRVDPRSLAQLADDSQYAVVAQGLGGTIDAIVTELASGGDNVMSYEGFPAP